MYAIDTGGTLEYRDKKTIYIYIYLYIQYKIQNVCFFSNKWPLVDVYVIFAAYPSYNKGFLRRISGITPISRSHISTNISFFQPNQKKRDGPPPNPTPSTQIFSKPLCQVTRNEIGSALHWPRSVRRKFCHSQEAPKELRKVNDHLVPPKNVSRIFATQIVGCGVFIFFPGFRCSRGCYYKISNNLVVFDRFSTCNLRKIGIHWLFWIWQRNTSHLFFYRVFARGDVTLGSPCRFTQKLSKLLSNPN